MNFNHHFWLFVLLLCTSCYHYCSIRVLFLIFCAEFDLIVTICATKKWWIWQNLLMRCFFHVMESSREWSTNLKLVLIKLNSRINRYRMYRHRMYTHRMMRFYECQPVSAFYEVIQVSSNLYWFEISINLSIESISQLFVIFFRSSFVQFLDTVTLKSSDSNQDTQSIISDDQRSGIWMPKKKIHQNFKYTKSVSERPFFLDSFRRVAFFHCK